MVLRKYKLRDLSKVRWIRLRLWSSILWTWKPILGIHNEQFICWPAGRLSISHELCVMPLWPNEGDLKPRGYRAPRRTDAITKDGEQRHRASSLSWNPWTSSCDVCSQSYSLFKVLRNVDWQDSCIISSLDPCLWAVEHQNILPVAKLGYARQSTDAVTIAPQVENHLKSAMGHGH
jgi:hypothetical protein